MSCKPVEPVEPSTPAATQVGHYAQPGAATLMLLLTIRWASTATRGMLPIEVLPVSAVHTRTPTPKPAMQKSRHPGTDADLPMPTTSGEPFDPVASLPASLCTARPRRESRESGAR